MLRIHYFSPTAEWHSSFVEGQTEVRLTYMKAGRRVYSDFLIQTAGPRRMKRLRRYLDKGYCDQSRKPLTNLFYQYTAYGESESGPLTSVMARA